MKRIFAILAVLTLLASLLSSLPFAALADPSPSDLPYTIDSGSCPNKQAQIDNGGMHHWMQSDSILATCITAGYVTYQCQYCFQYMEQQYAPALGHRWSAWEVLRNPTCTQSGEHQRVCERCKEVESEAMPALGHIWDNGTVTKAATCYADGEKTYACTRCKATRTDTIPALGHDWHEYVSYEATCTEAGMISQACSRCGASTELRAIPALGHAWNGGVVTREATCLEPGVRTYTCTRCGITRTEAIPASGSHLWGEWQVEYPGTCVTQGMNVRRCARCGAEEYVYSGYGDHDWGEWIVTAPALPGVEGMETRTCRLDPSHVENRFIPALEQALPQAALTLTAADDFEKSAGNPYPAGQDTFDPGDGVKRLYTITNTGDVPMFVVLYDHRADGFRGHAPIGLLNPGESDIRWCGSNESEYNVTPGTETDDLLGTVTMNIFCVGYDPAAYVNAENPGPELCRSETVPTTWKVRKPAADYVLKGFRGRFSGYQLNSEGCYPQREQTELIWQDRSFPLVESVGFFTRDKEDTLVLQEAPQPGETYYFKYTLYTDDGFVEFGQIDPALVNVTVDGFRVEYLEAKWYSGGPGSWVNLYFKAVRLGDGTAATGGSELNPSVSLYIWADPGAGDGKRVEGAIVPIHYEVTNTGDCPVYVLWWEPHLNVYDVSAPNGPIEVDGMGWEQYTSVALLEPGQTYSEMEDEEVLPRNVEHGYLSLIGWDHYWYYDADGNVCKGDAISNNLTIPLTYPDGVDPDPDKPALEIVWSEDEIYDDGTGTWYLTTAPGALAAEDGAWADFDVTNTGNVALKVYTYACYGNGDMHQSCPWLLTSSLAPGNSDWDSWGAEKIGDYITPGTETADLLGTVTITFWATGHDPVTGEQLCETEHLSRTWEIEKPGRKPWSIPEESKLTVSIGEASSSTDPAGYQLTEWWDTCIYVRNEGPVDVPEYTIHVDYVADSEVIHNAASFTDGAAWYEEPFTDGIPALTEQNRWFWGPWGRITEQDVARGYVKATAYVTWTDPDSGNPRESNHDTVCLPVIGKTDLLLRKGIGQQPRNGLFFQEGEDIPWVLTVTNTSDETMLNVTVTDQGAVVGQFDEIAPGEMKICSVPAYTVTEYDTRIGMVSNIAFAQGTDRLGVERTYPSNSVSVPTSAASLTPLPPVYVPGGDPVKCENGGDGALPPGSATTPTQPGTPGGGPDPMDPENVAATVYKNTAHLPHNGDWYALGETIDYTITVKNTGKKALENLEMYDSLGGLYPIASLPALAPGEEHVFTFAWTVAQADMDRGYVQNRATLTYTVDGISGTPRQSNPVYVKAGANGFIPPLEENGNPSGSHINSDGTNGSGNNGSGIPHFPGLNDGSGANGSGIHGEMGKDFCALEINAVGDSEIRYTLHTCEEHKAVARQAATLGAKDAAGLWRAEIDQLYETLYLAGDDTGKAAVMDDRVAFWAYIDAWTALRNDDEALRGMLRLRCAELCLMIHTAPDKWPGSLAADHASLRGAMAADACQRTFSEATGEMTLRFDADHREALMHTLDLVYGTTSYAHDDAFAQAQYDWQTVLDHAVNISYRSADREERRLIVACRQALDTMINARTALLELLYEDVPEVPAEAAMNLYRDALMDACGHR